MARYPCLGSPCLPISLCRDSFRTVEQQLTGDGNDSVRLREDGAFVVERFARVRALVFSTRVPDREDAAAS